MRKAALLLLLLLGGCAYLSPAKFDTIETASYIEVWQWGSRYDEACGDRPREHYALTGLAVTMERLSLLVTYGPDEDSKKIFSATLKVVREASTGASYEFCKETASNIKKAAEHALRAVGRRPR